MLYLNCYEMEIEVITQEEEKYIRNYFVHENERSRTKVIHSMT